MMRDTRPRTAWAQWEWARGSIQAWRRKWEEATKTGDGLAAAYAEQMVQEMEAILNGDEN